MATLEQQMQNEITEIGNLAMAHFETLSDDDKSWYVLHASPPCPNFSVAKTGAEETELIKVQTKVRKYIDGEWANLTGRYHDVSDYKRMCRSCHCKHDGLIKNIKHMAEKLND